ncbi:unnamed protein product [Taenia asiatica]|uniref:Uncharacterized protein n=1 Tax=Taenia asiatica TaxID=60517 RepID=A0A0R3WFN5_TAEAS|nr:unnamed protein product [Taenia asiatica]
MLFRRSDHTSGIALLSAERFRRRGSNHFPAPVLGSRAGHGDVPGEEHRFRWGCRTLTRFRDRTYKGAIRPVVSDVNCWEAEDINPSEWMPMVVASATRQHSIYSISEGPFPGSITEVNSTQCREVSTFVH